MPFPAIQWQFSSGSNSSTWYRRIRPVLGAFIRQAFSKKRRQELLARTPSGVERRARLC